MRPTLADVLVDFEDAHFLVGGGWRVEKSKCTYYVARTIVVDGTRSTERLHRVICGAAAGELVDHKNSNGLDNRRCNLRKATSAQNVRNSRIRKNNKVGFKGVIWDKQKSKYRARIVHNYKRTYLGHYDTPEQAHAAYCEAAEKLHGAFANSGRATLRDD